MIDKYGKKAAFFCTDDAQTELLFKRIAEGKGFVIEADHPLPLMGYSGALGFDLADAAGDFPAILKRIEEAVIIKGGAGRMGTLRSPWDERILLPWLNTARHWWKRA